MCKYAACLRCCTYSHFSVCNMLLYTCTRAASTPQLHPHQLRMQSISMYTFIASHWDCDHCSHSRAQSHPSGSSPAELSLQEALLFKELQDFGRHVFRILHGTSLILDSDCDLRACWLLVWIIDAWTTSRCVADRTGPDGLQKFPKQSDASLNHNLHQFEATIRPLM